MSDEVPRQRHESAEALAQSIPIVIIKEVL
jgi:hypothetical protein